MSVPRSRVCRLLARLLFLSMCGVMAGCAGETGPQCYPVRGEVRLEGQPLAEAMILFHPLNDAEVVRQKPLAISDSSGRFQLMTHRPNDGAPPGDYAITVELRELRADGDEMIRDGRNLLPERYRDPATSGFRFTVKAGENEVPALELQSK